MKVDFTKEEMLILFSMIVSIMKTGTDFLDNKTIFSDLIENTKGDFPKALDALMGLLTFAKTLPVQISIGDKMKKIIEEIQDVEDSKLLITLTASKLEVTL